MKCQAIIAEYNPFHNGHRYLIEAATKITDAQCTIALMSGCFLQRGCAAMWDKYTRASMCVSAGIDLALELPFPYATGSAYDFANAAVSILNKLGFIDYLCFGAESDDIECMNQISDILINEPEGFSVLLKKHLSLGKPYPSARQAALLEYTNDENLSSVIKTPNNILAIEYICALKRTNSSIKPVIIKRMGSGYHDKNLIRQFSSATAIRTSIENNLFQDKNSTTLSDIRTQIPDSVYDIIMKTSKIYGVILPEDILPFLQSAILSSAETSDICDLSPELFSRIKKTSACKGYRKIIDDLNTKNITETRICRSLIHFIMGYTNNDRNSFVKDSYAYYANILAIKKEKTYLIRDVKSKSAIPLITKKADFAEYMSQYPEINSKNASRMWQLDTRATDLYNCLIYNRYGYTADNDYTIKLPVL